MGLLGHGAPHHIPKRFNMNTISKKRLKAKLEAHRLWVDNSDQPGAERLVLHGYNLRRMDFRGCDLRYAELDGSDLGYAKLDYCKAAHCDFRKCMLWGASMIGVRAPRAQFTDAVLCTANLKGANLLEAIMHDCDLSNAELIDASLVRANLDGAKLNGCDLENTDFTGARLKDVQGGDETNRVMSLHFGRWSVVVLDAKRVWGGCTEEDIFWWLERDDMELVKADREYLNTVTKPFLKFVLKRVS
jgi:hypothetical protein